MLQAPWVQVASVGFPSFGQKALAGIRSALFFASRPLRFHLVVDALGQRDVQRALDSLEPWLREKGVAVGDWMSWRGVTSQWTGEVLPPPRWFWLILSFFGSN